MRRTAIGMCWALLLGLGAAYADPPDSEPSTGLPPRFMPHDDVPATGEPTGPDATPPGIQAVVTELKGQALVTAPGEPLPPQAEGDSVGEGGSAGEGGSVGEGDPAGEGGAAVAGDEAEAEEGDEGEENAEAVVAGSGALMARIIAELQAGDETRNLLVKYSLSMVRSLRAAADPAWLAEWHPPASVGGISTGRLLFATQMTDSPGIHMRHPELAWTVPEVVEHLRAAGDAVRRKHPGGMDLQISDISVRKGGKLKPHFTHRNGRDVDLRYYLLDVAPGDHTHHFVGPDKLDCKRLWTFIDTLVARNAVNLIYMDYRLQKALYDYAIKHLKRTPAELYSVISWPKAKRRTDAVIQHAKNHFSHMHIRFKTPRSTFVGSLYTPEEAEDLQRRVDLATRGSYEYAIKRGETLGLIARKHKVSLEELLRTNRLTEKSKVRPGQVLNIPVNGPRRVR